MAKGMKTGSYRSVGTTYDGVRILAPKTKPTHFTASEIRTMIAKVRRESEAGKFAATREDLQRKKPLHPAKT